MMNEVYRKKRKRRKKRRKKKSFSWLGVVSIALLILIFLLAGLILFYKHGQSKFLKNENEMSLTFGDQLTEAARAEKAHGLEWQDNWVVIDDEIYAYNTNCINLLFLGVDKKGKIDKETDLRTDSDPGQTDAVFVMSLNPDAGTVKIIGIPRNALIDLDKYDESGDIYETVEDQLCLQFPYAGGGLFGIEKTREKVSAILYNLPIHDSFALSYESIPIVNDMVGGVDIEVLEDLTKENKKFKVGEDIHLEGREAITYVKWRDISKSGTPTGRLKRQKQYILELFKQTKDSVKSNPLMIAAIYNAVGDYMLTDMKLDDAIYLASKVVKCGFGNNDFYLIDGEDVIVFKDEDNKNSDDISDAFNDYRLSQESIDEIMKEVFFEKVDLD